MIIAVEKHIRTSSLFTSHFSLLQVNTHRPTIRMMHYTSLVKYIVFLILDIKNQFVNLKSGNLGFVDFI